VDLISEVIRTVRAGSCVGSLIRQSGSRGIRFPAIAGSGLHVILRGACWLITEDGEPVALKPGDVVFVSSGAGHGLSRVPCALQDLPPAVMAPVPPAAGPFDFELACAAYWLANGQIPQYLRMLPDFITVSPDYGRHPEMRALTALLAADASAAQPQQLGTGATLPAVLDLILAHVLRQWHEQHDAAGWPESDDPAIAAALGQIHEDPRRQWTVARLSQAAGLPRTAFTRRFTAVTGQPPMRYVISWRLGQGARLLRETDAPLAAIARQVGYSTEFAFAGAFRREYGVSPGRFRRTPAPGIASDTAPEPAISQ
jgi:AraC-like DNA-binding protein